MTEPDYDAVPYESAAIPYSAPGSLAALSHLLGGPAPGLGAGTRVLELGCGDGRNLLPLAFHHPRWELSGLDLSPRAIERARIGATELGLTNVRFEVADVMGASPQGAWDYILAHGLYSWVDGARQSAIRELLARSLSPAGLAFVSFNAQPGWGARGRVRDSLLRARPPGDGAAPTLAEARGLAGELQQLLVETTPDPDATHPWKGVLGAELARLASASDGYLAHEYLAEENHAFWLGELVEAFEGSGLAYVGDALLAAPEGFVPPEIRARASELWSEPIRREERIDLLFYRQLRAGIFSRGRGLPRSPSSSEGSLAERLRAGARLAGVITPRSGGIDAAGLLRGREVRFTGPRGTELQVDSALAKLALLQMGSAYPDAFLLDELLTQAHLDARSRGLEVQDQDEGRLVHGLAELITRQEIEVRLDHARLRRPASPRPSASRLTRWEAARGGSITAATHRALPIEPIDRAIVHELDGRPLNEAVEAVVARLGDAGSDVEGVPAGDARRRAAVEARAEALVRTLGWWGLLE